MTRWRSVTNKYHPSHKPTMQITRSLHRCAWICVFCGVLAAAVLSSSAAAPQTLFVGQQAYLKASNTGALDYFADPSAVSISGEIVVIGAPLEASDAIGVNGDQENDNAPRSGAAYVFVRQGNEWVQEAYLKPSNTERGDLFGIAVAISGNTIVIGAEGEDSNSTGVNGDGENNLATDSGAAYVFVREGTNWTQQAYLKASNTDTSDFFGSAVAISGDTIVVGAEGEASGARGVNGDQNDNSLERAGAAYVFVRQNGKWHQEAYLKASNTDTGDDFGGKVAISGNTIAIAADAEDSSAAGVNGNQENNDEIDSGAVYVFTRTGATWTQQAYIKASNPASDTDFGEGLSIWGDTLIVGAPGDGNDGVGINNPGADNFGAPASGAVYVYVRNGTNGTSWRQQAFLKASNRGAGDFFGRRVAIWQDTLVAGAGREDSGSTGVNYNQDNDTAEDAGAAYVFVRTDRGWVQQAYLKASNTEAGDNFGAAVAVSGDTVVIGAYDESSDARAVNGNTASNDAESSGAAYVFTGVGPITATAVPGTRVIVSWPQGDQIFDPITTAQLNRPWIPRFEGSSRSFNGTQELEIAPSAQSQFFRFAGEGIYYSEPKSFPAPIADETARVRGPSLSSDGLSLYFFSDKLGHADLWVATRSSLTSQWNTATSIKEINTSAEESFPAISSDGLSLYFSDWFLYFRGPNPRTNSYGGGDIWVAQRRDLRSKWNGPYNLGPQVNSGFLETTPAISSDGLTLIFATDRPGNVPGSGRDFDGTDLWMCVRTNAAATNGWSKPVNLGPGVNSIYGDSSPFLSADGLTLYFASARPSPDARNGFSNIWAARRKSVSEPFGTAVSLGHYFEGLHHMMDPCFSADGATLFFSSRGRLDQLFPLANLWQISVRPFPPLSIRLIKSVEP